MRFFKAMCMAAKVDVVVDQVQPSKIRSNSNLDPEQRHYDSETTIADKTSFFLITADSGR